MEKKTIVYIVKWYITRGIVIGEAPEIDFEQQGFISCEYTTDDGHTYSVCLSRTLVFRTIEEAEEAADNIVLRKIKSLQKQIDKLTKLKFKFKK